MFQTVIIDVTDRKQKAKNQRLTSPESLTQLQKRFARSGLGDFNCRETIELLMTFYPCGEHNHLIDRACEVFANVGELLSASPQKLQQLGFPAGCISYIKLMHDIPAQVLREKIIERPVYQSSREIFDYLYYSMRDLKKEVFKVLFLDKGDRVIDTADLFKGTPDAITIHPREIVVNAISYNASALIFVHNHPTGDPTPGKKDKNLTRDLVFVGNILQIKVLDHLIIGDNRYFSFADEGLIQKYEDVFLNLRIRNS